MTDKTGTADEGRRSFLKFVGVAAPAAAATAAGTGAAEAAEEPKAEGSGLRRTAHVEAYLASARF